jgi:hypothetical protein
MCNRCGKTLASPQKLREHLNRIYPCKPQDTITSAENNKDKIIQEEFERLGMISGDQERDIIFREQELGPALRRRAVANYNAVVSSDHPDNGSDIRKMLESQRKNFREILEKEYYKRGQFKFALCSFTKFIVGNNVTKTKNSRTDWLRNKQIIVYNHSEIDNYISNAIEQIVNQAEERAGS